MRLSWMAMAVLILGVGLRALPSTSGAQSRELSFQICADEGLTTLLNGPIDFGPVPMGGLSRNGTPTPVWIVNTGQRTFVLTDFRSDSLVGTVILSAPRPDVLPGQKVKLGFTFKADFQAPIGSFVASIHMVASNEYGMEPIDLVGVGGIIPPQAVAEFPSGPLTLAATLLALALVLRRASTEAIRA